MELLCRQSASLSLVSGQWSLSREGVLLCGLLGTAAVMEPLTLRFCAAAAGWKRVFDSDQMRLITTTPQLATADDKIALVRVNTS